MVTIRELNSDDENERTIRALLAVAALRTRDQSFASVKADFVTYVVIACMRRRLDIVRLHHYWYTALLSVAASR